ncbi:TPA: Rrf2 family transcriptional regulator [Neisseria subflava]|jgi:transcriptional regulator, Rrf2 family|uniref:Transcriptional regulator, Rrf2 family n=3 Tax=Neisseria TaxID=482 RepID=A0A9W5ISW7_NEISU|nr:MULTISPECIES: Rrf2 family transcriptional regulator [Neisseria]MBF1279895.1 Rrf2 family transcriptional regulator [Neisseria lactamica]EFC53043.1 transcriptional regulator, Rrf2 family [Neisseria subflava NJ9703]KGJ31833.1 Rrf2 family transcriptional regulator [Neisseria mucosa]KZC78069.1 HTH-type transcriptional regulator NsrR [Neisseria flavescens]KZC81370.1 HTH-type transcriptional regulator NsrR [Neisseria flavescens]
MYLTQHTDYGLRVLVYTAINDDTLVNIGTIAETYNISKSHLMKVVTSLVKGGFLVSVRGKGGGLRLADNPENINIGAVVRHLEPMQVVECMGDNNECLITPSCRLTGIITGAIKAFFNHLDQYSLQDLLDKPTYDILYTPRIPINEIRGTAD